MKVTVKLNTAPALKAIRAQMQPRMTIAADEMRNALAASLDAGDLPIHSDTMALSKSLSVMTPQGSDGAERLADAATAYMAGGHHTAGVRRFVTAYAYTDEHFNDRVAPEEPLLPGGVQAKVFTSLSYGYYWFIGHNNVYTGRDEAPRDWIMPFATAWATENMTRYFEAVL